MLEDVAAKIRFFFENPATAPATHANEGAVSVLYLLRRELMETAGHNPNVTLEMSAVEEGVKNRLFASLILMFTGFDMLAKFASDASRTGERFREFLQSEDGGSLPEFITTILYAVRNSLVHAFGIPDEQALRKIRMTGISLAQSKVMDTSAGKSYVVADTDGDTAVVYVNGLYRTFVGAVGNFQDSLFGTDSQPARERFNRAFDQYGTIFLRMESARD
jgi:hypothetical protein